MVAALDPIRKVPCTKQGCYNSFSTDKEMKRHKASMPDHFYCKKCDVDCDDWEDLTQHKVEAMAPWVEGRMKGLDERPQHIVCEFCGEDFKSFGGRKMHRAQEHPADQDVSCPGCTAHFTRAAQMVKHLEDGHCHAISRVQFMASIQKKYVVRQMLEDPGLMALNIRQNKALCMEAPGYIADTETVVSDEDDEDGGVAVLDHQDDNQSAGVQPLEPERDLVDVHESAIQSPKNRYGAWPKLPGEKPLAEAMRNISLQSSVPRSTTSDSQYMNELTSNCGSPRSVTDSWPSLKSPDRSSPPINQLLDPAEAAWVGTSTANTLFPGAKETRPDATTLSIIEQRTIESSKSSNLFHSRFWDPSSPEWDPRVFYNTEQEVYSCPFPSCTLETFNQDSEVEDHIFYAHVKTQYRCPSCLKIFKGPSNLVAHCETTQKCNVQKSKHFKTLIDEITGGFLASKPLLETKIYRPEKAVVKAGHAPVHGVMKTKFTGQMPEGR